MSLTQSSNAKSSTANSESVRRAVLKLQQLPASVTVVLAALDASEDPLCTNERLQEILSADPGAAVDLLRLANSAYFGVTSQIRTLTMAITVVGHGRLRLLLRHIIVGKLFETLAVPSDLATRTRTVSLATGVVCHELGKKLSRADAEELLLGGLLHNVGDLALLSELPEDYEQVAALRENMPKREAEISVFGVDSFAVSQWLLESWCFPEMFRKAAAHWDSPDQPSFSPTLRSFVAIIHIAAALADAWVEGRQAKEATTCIAEPVVLLAKASADSLLKVYGKIPAGVEKLRQTF